MNEPQNPTHRIRTVVVGLDGSPGSERALAWTVPLALQMEALVIAVHVLTYDAELARDVLPETAMSTWRVALQEKLRSEWTRPLAEAGVHHRCVLVEDSGAAAGLMRVADAEQTELIVVGSNGRGSLAGRVLGSTTYTLTHRAHRPVVMVPHDWSRSTAGV